MTPLMSATQTIDEIVRAIVRMRASGVVPDEEFPDDLPFGVLGLDSIAMAEVLLDCQQRFGVRTVDLLEGEPLTLRRLVTYVERETRA
jgi:acyl carrier protein